MSEAKENLYSLFYVNLKVTNILEIQKKELGRWGAGVED